MNEVTGLEVASRFSAEVSQIDVGLAAVDDGVGIFARSFRRQTVRHRHLNTMKISHYNQPLQQLLPLHQFIHLKLLGQLKGFVNWRVKHNYDKGVISSMRCATENVKQRKNRLRYSGTQIKQQTSA